MTPQVSAVPVFQPVEKPELWLSFREVAQVVSYADGAGAISLREIQRRVNAGEYVARVCERRARNGRPVREIALSSLPADAQARHIARLSDGEIAAEIRDSEIDTPALPVRLRGNEVPITDDGTVDFAALRAAGRSTDADRAEHRLQVVCACMAEIGKVGARQGRIKMWHQLAGRFDTPVKTMMSWATRYRRGGSRALVPGWGGANRGVYRSIPDGLARAIKAAYRQQQRQSVAQIMLYTVEPFCRAHSIPRPNRTTVARFLAHEVDAAERIAFREGPRAAEARVMPKAIRDPRDLAPNQIFCADHRILDIFILTPDGKSHFRPWITAFCDLATADFSGWCASTGPSALTVALALRAAIIKRGVPDQLYVDNGKEFIAKQFGGKAYGHAQRRTVEYPTANELANRASWPAVIPEYLQGSRTSALFAQLGIRNVVHAKPLHAWSKPIESFFRAFHARWENMTPGYCGNTPKARPEKLARELNQHMLLDWSQFLKIFAQHVAEWNARPHGERAFSPDQLYNRAGDKLRRASESALDLLMLKSSGDRPRIVQNNGIEVEGRHFLCNDLLGYLLHPVHVWYDPCNLSHIVVRPVCNPNLRIVVPEIGHSGWNGWNAVTEQIASFRHAKKSAFKLIAASDRAALDVAQVDPHGANRMAAENARELKLAEIVLPGDATKASDIAAMRQAERADKAVEKAVETAHKAAVAEAADDVFARAKREIAWRNGETGAAIPEKGA